MMKDLVSVVIPVYNVEQYVKNCVNSVIKQTYNKLEIILVDDGSTDSSGKICNELALRDSRIKVLHKVNGGLSDARNFGIKRATGSFITFIDSDDIVSANLIAHLMGIIKEYKADISICNPVHIFSKQGENYQFKNPSKIESLTSTQALNMMFYQKDFLVSAWGKLYKRSFFNNMEFPVGMLFEDIAIMYKLFYRAKRIVYSDAQYYGYCHRENSITTNAFSPRDLDILKICDALLIFANEHPEFEKSVQCYVVNANFRIYLNAPRTQEYEDIIFKCKKYISNNAHSVLKDKNVRNKLKVAITIFLINKKLLMKIYPKINRWK